MRVYARLPNQEKLAMWEVETKLPSIAIATVLDELNDSHITTIKITPTILAVIK